jgi:glycosyltransferase involved in cell wall biosynthesis
VIAPTRFLAKAYTNNGLRVPMHRMPFGIDMPETEKPAVAPESPLRFGFIGQLAIHKGPDILIDAFLRLPPAAAELRLYGTGVAGDPYLARLHASAEGHAITFCGTFPSEQIADVLAEVDFLVIPSRWYENSPLVLLGALASHTPVIVSDVEGMSEFVEHGKNGFLFSRGSNEALSVILRDLIQDPAAARAMSADTSYPRSTKTMTEDLVTVYESVLADAAGNREQARR